MNVYRRILIVFFILVQSCFAGGDFGNWYAETPFDNTLNNEWNMIFFRSRKSGRELEHLEKWFFYKSYIAGSYFREKKTGREHDESRRGYFVIDEERDTIRLFDTAGQWLGYRAENGINPVLFTRWFDHDWQFFRDESFSSCGFFVMIIMIMVSALVLAYFVIVALKVFFSRVRGKGTEAGLIMYMKKPLLLLSALAAIALIRTIMDFFPYSI